MNIDRKNLASAAFAEAKSSGALASIDEATMDTMARDISGDDPITYASVMDEYDTQTILSEREAIAQSFAAEESAMHEATRASMVRTLGLSPQEYARALADEKTGNSSTLLSMKEAYVFR